MRSPIHLIVQYCNDPRPARAAEYDECFRRNLANPHVVAVHNLAGRDARTRLELGGEGSLVDLFHDQEHDLDKGAVSLELSPYDARWFRVRRPGQRLPP